MMFPNEPWINVAATATFFGIVWAIQSGYGAWVVGALSVACLAVAVVSREA